MKKQFFKVIHKVNQVVLPKVSGKDPLKFTKFERLLAGFKYYVLINSMD